MRKLSHQPSHLSVESQQAKHKPWKAACDFCWTNYNIDLSNSMQPNRYCSLECEIFDKNESDVYIEHQKAKPLR